MSSLSFNQPYVGQAANTQLIQNGQPGGWSEITRTTSTSTGYHSLDVSTDPKFDSYMVIMANRTDHTFDNFTPRVRIDGDSSSVYDRMNIRDWKTSVNDTNQTKGLLAHDVYYSYPNTRSVSAFVIGWFNHVYYGFGTPDANNVICSSFSGGGDNGNILKSGMQSFYYSNKIDSTIDIDVSITETTHAREIIILGKNYGDNDTTNFWQDLGTTTLSGTSSNIQITPGSYKYLWVQAFLKPTASLQPYLRFNGVSTGTPYYCHDYVGTTDTLNAASSKNQIPIGTTSANNKFANFWIENHSDSNFRRVVTGITTDQGNAFLGYTGVYNSTSQVTTIDFVPSTSTFASGTTIKVWGAN